MIRKIAEYTVHDGALEAVQEAIGRFVAAVHEAEPATVYEAYRLEEEHSFLHFMAFENADAEEAHRRAPYTQTFVAALYPRCVEPPRFTELRKVDGG